MKSLLIIPLLLTGCMASSHKFATIGDTDFYCIKSPSLLGPSINLVASKKTNEVSPTILTHYGGNGIAGATVHAAGFVGGAATFGASIRPDSDQTTVVTAEAPPVLGPPAPPPQKPITIGNPKNDRPFSHGHK